MNGRSADFGDRLKLARKRAGFSLRALSEAMGGSITAQSIGKYERGEMMPSSSVLIKVSEALDVSLTYLMSSRVSELKEIEFRRKSRVPAREKAQVEAEVIEKLERYINIEEILDIDGTSHLLPEVESRFLGGEEDGEVLAEDLRREWRLGIDPISNMTALLETHGLKVLLFDLPGGVSGLTCLAQRSGGREPVPAIIVNRNMTLERRRFTLAHELAHRLIEVPTFPTVNREKGADMFAGALLVPREHLLRQAWSRRNAFSFKEIARLKRFYRVSAATLLVRIKQVGIISDSALAYAFQTYAKGWRSHEPEALEPEEKRGQYEAPHRFELLCYWALAEKLIGLSKACELLQCSLEDIRLGMKGRAGP